MAKMYKGSLEANVDRHQVEAMTKAGWSVEPPAPKTATKKAPEVATVVEETSEDTAPAEEEEEKKKPVRRRKKTLK